VSNPFAAQDVVQNAFIKLFKNWEPGMKPSARVKGWLYRVTHNEAVDLIRKESRRRALHERHAEEQDACPDGRNCAMSEQERRALVLTHLGKLDEREQQVVLLRLEEGLSYKEISEATGRTVGNVGNILHHAVRKLSKSLRAAGATS
jgi:RNA polymerase sigma-70 factor (ECF subfamily)